VVKLGAMDHWFDRETVVPGDTIEERLANLAAWGYQGLHPGVVTREIPLADLKRAFANSSVKWLTHARRGRILGPDEETRQAAVEEICQGLREAAQLGVDVGSLMVPIRVQPEMASPPPPKTLVELETEILVEQLRKIAPVAEEVGVPIVLEPLNRYETHLLTRLGQTAKVCRATGSPAIKMMADFFHMNIEEADMAQAIEESADRLAYVHLADSNRYQPGAGHLDFRTPLAALKRVGYGGFMTLECRILGEDKGAALQESARLIRATWDAV
jgi:sugar phosphate isomerase/epimerase